MGKLSDEEGEQPAFQLSMKAPGINNREKKKKKLAAAAASKKRKTSTIASSSGSAPLNSNNNNNNHNQHQQKKKKGRRASTSRNGKIPIPSFRSDPSLERLEREFFDSSSSSSSEDDEEDKKGGERKKPSRAEAAAAVLDLDTSEDDEDGDDDLLNFDTGLSLRGRSDKKKPVLLPAAAPAEEGTAPPNRTGLNEDKENGSEILEQRAANGGVSHLLDSGSGSGSSSDNNNESLFSSTTTTTAEPILGGDTSSSNNHNPPPATADKTALLLRAVGDVFAESDVYTITVKQVMARLQPTFGGGGGQPFDKETKIIIREELTRLVDQTQKEQQQQYRSTAKVKSMVDVIGRGGATHASSRMQVVGGDTAGPAASQKPAEKASCRSDVVTAGTSSAGGEAGGKTPFKPGAVSPVTKPHQKQPAKKATRAEPRPLSKHDSSGTAATRATRKRAAGGSSKSSTETTTTKPTLPTKEPAAPSVQPQAQRRRGRSTKSSAIASTATAPTKAAAAAAKKNGPSRKRKARCQLCSNCPCTFDEGGATETMNLSSALSQSDAAIERALMKRLHKLEQITERHEDQTEAVRRKLKKHRRDMWRKFEESENLLNPGKDKSRFLPDAQELDQQWDDYKSKRLDPSLVAKAKGAVFSSNYQPTLTQMLGMRSNPKGDDESDEKALSPVAEEEDNNDAAGSEVEVKAQADAETVVDLDDESERAHVDLACSNNNDGDKGEEEEEEEQEAEESELDDALLNVLRIEVRNGIEDGDQPARIWGSCHGDFSCPWDLLLQSPSEAIDLVHTFAAEVESGGADEAPAIGMSMLSQRGKQLANDLVSGISNDSAKLAAIESACPDWRENVTFALHQREAGDIESALKGVKDARAKLLRTKAAILKAAEEQESALSVFETALCQSMSRFDGRFDENENEERQGFIPSQARSSPNMRAPQSGSPGMETGPVSPAYALAEMPGFDYSARSPCNGESPPGSSCSKNPLRSPLIAG